MKKIIAATILAIACLQAAKADEAFSPETKSDYVTAIQAELAKAGFYHGIADGIDGPATERAASAWRKAAGLPGEGLDAAMLDMLRFGDAVPRPKPGEAVARPTVKADPWLAWAEEILAKKGYYQGFVDGRPTKAADAAIRKWQTDAGLPVDGKAGPQTLKSLADACAAPVPAKPAITGSAPPESQPETKPAPVADPATLPRSPDATPAAPFKND